MRFFSQFQSRSVESSLNLCNKISFPKFSLANVLEHFIRTKRRIIKWFVFSFDILCHPERELMIPYNHKKKLFPRAIVRIVLIRWSVLIHKVSEAINVLRIFCRTLTQFYPSNYSTNRIIWIRIDARFDFAYCRCRPDNRWKPWTRLRFCFSCSNTKFSDLKNLVTMVTFGIIMIPGQFSITFCFIFMHMQKLDLAAC